MEFYGYAGRLLYIDLSREKIEEKELSMEDIVMFMIQG